MVPSTNHRSAPTLRDTPHARIACTEQTRTVAKDAEEHCIREMTRSGRESWDYWDIAPCIVHYMANVTAGTGWPSGPIEGLWNGKAFSGRDPKEAYKYADVKACMQQYVIAAEKGLIPEYVEAQDMETVIRWMTQQYKQWKEPFIRVVMWHFRQAVKECVISALLLQPKTFATEQLRNSAPEIKQYLQRQSDREQSTVGWTENIGTYVKWAGIGLIAVVGVYGLSNVTRLVRTFRSDDN